MKKNFSQRLEECHIQHPFRTSILFMALALILFSISVGSCLSVQASRVTKAVTAQKDSAKLQEVRYCEEVLACKKAGDSISHQLLVDMQTNYEYRLNNVLADLRQAHNDTITLLSIHFSFWICVIALAGGIVPLVSNTLVKKRIDQYIEKKEDEMERLLNYAKLRSEEERFYITIQNMRTLANLGHAYFLQDIREQVNEMFEKLIDYNTTITTICESKLPIKEGVMKEKGPDILIYKTSLVLLVQQLRMIYSSREHFRALDMTKNVADEMKKDMPIEEWCKLVKRINGYLNALKIDLDKKREFSSNPV